MKRRQLNIVVGDDLLKSLKLLAIEKNVKLNSLVKEILSEKINKSLNDNISASQANTYRIELNKLTERVANIEKGKKLEN
mgnify:CR=1 FL=1